MKSLLPKNLSNPFHYGDRLNPARDWLILVIVGAALLLASLGWNALLFLRVTNGSPIGNAPAPAPLNPASIDSVNALFRQRAETETQYKNGTFVDPSTPAG